jgi:intraflagellar transport protein 56
MDYYDVSLEILNGFLSQNPTSIIAANLKACNQYQVFNGKAAEAELNQMQQYYESGNLFNDYDLLRHNLVVFRGGQNALQVSKWLSSVYITIILLGAPSFGGSLPRSQAESCHLSSQER